MDRRFSRPASFSKKAVTMLSDPFGALQEFTSAGGVRGRLYSLAALQDAGLGDVSRLPVSLRIVLESVLRNCDERKITSEHVRRLAGWKARAPRTDEIPFVVARILLQDFTGVPLLCDLAAMRSCVSRLGGDPAIIEPSVPVNLVVDHSVQVDHYNSPDALKLNMEFEFQRNAERYRFIKWGMQAFERFKVVPPGIGIVHQVNLEYLARSVWLRDGLFFPDTLVGTDSHTTMINGLGVVGWGVGGIEAEAGMLGQPLYFLTPDVVGVHLNGRLREGVTATDLVLAITEFLRQANVVGKFVEFFGAGAASLTLPDRATIANMAPEYGATMGFFPVDEETITYLHATGRSAEDIDVCRSYLTAQGLFGMPVPGQIDYTTVLELDLGSVAPCVSGPRRPQDRVELSKLKSRFEELFVKPSTEDGYGKHIEALSQRADKTKIGDGDVLIAAITSCTNTSNPGVMLAAGLLAKKAVELGLHVGPQVKTSLAPGSRVVTAYLTNAGLLPYLEKLGFGLVGYGCTTCIGNSGPLAEAIESAIVANDLVCAAVLSGNRNFEARIHANIRANFLMSPPLVVAFALAGKVNIDLTTEPLGIGNGGRLVYLKDVWPSRAEVATAMHFAVDPRTYRELYADFSRDNPLWENIAATVGEIYPWNPSTYIAEPPFFNDFRLQPDAISQVRGARALAIFGDSVTTDHISPAGSIKAGSPAGEYLLAAGVPIAEFNSYGARRGNHEVMMRGTFANVRIRNLMLPPAADGSPVVGGLTRVQPDGATMPIYDAGMKYVALGTPTVIFAGEEYGSGSSRDWAAKGTRLLGVRAVVARSFERIHRANLVCMGVLPLQFAAGDSAASLGIRGDEEFDIIGIDDDVKPQQEVLLVVRGANGERKSIPLRLRVDTPIEADYYRHGGILPWVLRDLMAAQSA
jgi:aconitate hydratase